MYLSDNTIKTLLYPKWSNSIYCNGKPCGCIFSDRDDWFFKTNDNLVNRYVEIIKSFRDIAGNKYTITKNSKALIPLITKGYMI